jgi:ketosteroid isomerase-like protein
MKRCPQCHQFFDDENLFCLNDGTELREDFPASAASNSVPTQVIPSISRETAVKKSSGKEIYWLCGALLLVVGALSFVIFALAWKPDRRSTEEKSEKAAENPNAKSPPKNETVEPSKAAELPPLTEQTARALIERWEKAQDARNFNAYKSCYAPSFFGVKRTKSGGETRMNYAEWLADRRKMLANTIDVGVRNLDVAIDGDTATARFVQQFQSVNYNDEGQKILKLKMFEDGAKIVYEEMKYSY